MKKIDLKALVISILIPVILGGFIGLLTLSSNNYQAIVKPSFAPPSIVFPIVWTILYILMGISSYLIYKSKVSKEEKENSLKIYIVQLIVNLVWPIIFFIVKNYFISFIWILLLIYLVLQMIFMFYKVNKIAAVLQIPYLIWIIFAGMLNMWIYILNK